jgi:hypothetical protein
MHGRASFRAQHRQPGPPYTPICAQSGSAALSSVQRSRSNIVVLMPSAAASGFAEEAAPLRRRFHRPLMALMRRRKNCLRGTRAWPVPDARATNVKMLDNLMTFPDKKRWAADIRCTRLFRCRDRTAFGADPAGTIRQSLQTIQALLLARF